MKRSNLLVLAALLLSLGLTAPAEAFDWCTISGYKWHDLNADGIWDPGEPALSGWTIHLVGAAVWGTPVNRSTVTGADGSYMFIEVYPGSYELSEECEPDWFQSYPAPTNGCGSGVHNLKLVSGQTSTNNNFGNYQDDLLPGFTLTKTCMEEPLQFGDDAVFNIELANTGNVDLIVELDEDVVDTLGVIVTASGTISAGVPFTLPVGQTLEATVTIPATTFPAESNTINAYITLPEWTGLSDSWTPTASDSCDVISMTLDKQIGTSAVGPWYDNLNPVPVGTPIYYRLVVTNNGPVDMDDVVVDDPTLGVTCNVGELAAGTSHTCGPYGPYPAQYNEGQELCNTATATGMADGVPLSDEDTACYITHFTCQSGTAYGLNDALSPACFNTLGFDNWGWTHGPLAYNGVYAFALWAGAAHCDTDNGTYAGAVTIDYTGAGAKGYNITYDLEDGFEIVEEHVYIGRDQVLKIKDGKYTVPTVAPGQYYVTKGIHSGSFYIIYHAVVEWCE